MPKTSIEMEKTLYSTLREHSKDFENATATNIDINTSDDKTRWQQLKGKNLTIETTSESRRLETEAFPNSDS